MEARRLADLARLTGRPAMECRRALETAGGDFEAARRALKPAPATWVEVVGSNGPDHFMEILVAGDPRPLVRTLPMAGFVRTERPGPIHSELRGGIDVESYDLYVDAYHHADILANFEGRASKNIWTYSIVDAAPGLVWIEHGYGSADPSCLASEMELIRALLEAGAPEIRSWSIEGGGQGYGQVVAASGVGAASLAELFIK